MKNRYGLLTKSDNAIYAEELGKRVYSKLKAWQKRAVDAGVISSCEWHHTSAAANKTFYYDLDDFEELDPKDFPPRKNEKERQADLSRLKIKITFEKMIGGFTSRNYKFEECTVEGLDVRKKDNVITGAEGRRLSSKNKEVIFLYKKPHGKKFKQITRKEVVDLGYKLI